MTPAGEILSQSWHALAAFFEAHGGLLLPFAASAAGAGCGAWFGARAILWREKKAREEDIQATANVAIASMIALMGRLLNFKKDLAFPALAEAEALEAALARGEKGKLGVRLELWPELPFALRLPNGRIFEYAGKELDVIQLLRMLDCRLHELTHLARQRNEQIRQMNAHQAARGALPVDGLRLYIRTAGEIARNVDENLFFLDHGIGKARRLALGLLPRSRHAAIAEIGLSPESEPLMPPKDLIKGWLK